MRNKNIYKEKKLGIPVDKFIGNGTLPCCPEKAAIPPIFLAGDTQFDEFLKMLRSVASL